MIFATDVQYHETTAQAAGVLFATWDAAVALREIVIPVAPIAPYVPGQFYQRELPGLLALLQQLETPPVCIIVDGHVYLDGAQTPGLGKHLYEALQGAIPVIGVAKSRFKDTPVEAELLRGASQRALYVTAVGLPLAEARANIQRMHGPHRLPTLLKRVDQLSKMLISKR